MNCIGICKKRGVFFQLELEFLPDIRLYHYAPQSSDEPPHSISTTNVTGGLTVIYNPKRIPLSREAVLTNILDGIITDCVTCNLYVGHSKSLLQTFNLDPNMNIINLWARDRRLFESFKREVYSASRKSVKCDWIQEVKDMLEASLVEDNQNSCTSVTTFCSTPLSASNIEVKDFINSYMNKESEITPHMNVDIESKVPCNEAVTKKIPNPSCDKMQIWKAFQKITPKKINFQVITKRNRSKEFDIEDYKSVRTANSSAESVEVTLSPTEISVEKFKSSVTIPSSVKISFDDLNFKKKFFSKLLKKPIEVGHDTNVSHRTTKISKNIKEVLRLKKKERIKKRSNFERTISMLTIEYIDDTGLDILNDSTSKMNTPMKASRNTSNIQESSLDHLPKSFKSAGMQQLKKIRRSNKIKPIDEIVTFFKLPKKDEKGKDFFTVAEYLPIPREPSVDSLVKSTVKASHQTLKSDSQIYYKPDIEYKNLDKGIHKESKPQINTDTGKGNFRYRLSDKKYIHNGITKLPQQQTSREIKVFEAYPSHSKLNWFEQRKGQVLYYPTGSIFADVSLDGTGLVLYESGEPAIEMRKDAKPQVHYRCNIFSKITTLMNSVLLGSFDWIGNGVVYDFQGNVRLQYNQSFGKILDTSIGPLCTWQWHKLNDPPIFKTREIESNMHVLLDDKELADDENKENMTVNMPSKSSIKAKSSKHELLSVQPKIFKISQEFTLKIHQQDRVHLIFKHCGKQIKLNLGFLLNSNKILMNVRENVVIECHPLEKAIKQKSKIGKILSSFKSEVKV